MKTAADAFGPLRAALEEAGIRYAVGGSWDSTAFGAPRLTNDVHILADFNAENLSRFLSALPEAFFADAGEARRALGLGRPYRCDLHADGVPVRLLSRKRRPLFAP